MNLISGQRFKEIVGQFEALAPVIVVGDIGIDKYTYGEVHRISPEAPVPVLEVKREWFKLGLSANVSDNLKALGIRSTLCGVIGNDKNADLFESLVEERELKTWGLVRSPKRPTVLKERVTTQAQQICRIDYESSDYQVDARTAKKLQERAKDFLLDHHALIIQDYNKGTLNEKLIKELISAGKRANKLVAVDPHRDTPPSYYRGATLLKPNFVESQHLVAALGYKGGKFDEKVDETAEILVDKLQLEKLVITRGKDGMALFDTKAKGGGRVVEIPTVSTQVFDVSGAGDTVIALLTASLMAQASLEEAACIANCGAGVVVRKKGTATVEREELENFYGELADRFSKFA